MKPTIMKKIIHCVLFFVSLTSVQPANAALTTWNNWTFDYQVSSNFDGLSLLNVKYQGMSLINKISLPVMRVFYNNNTCGPYADRLGGTIYPIPWANNATIGQRQFSLGGRDWYEIGIRDKIGSYDIYQVYYLSNDGILDAHIYSKGLQCIINHIHYPNWRIDFDIDGPANDMIEHLVGITYQLDGLEFNRKATNATDHNWRIRDTVTNNYVDMLPGFSGFFIPDGSTTIPVTDYSQHTVFGRLFKSSEDTGWTYGPNTQVPFGNNENINSQNLVAWYEGYLPHAAADGSSTWHSTGIRLVSNLSTATNPPAPDVIVTNLSYSNGIFTSTIKNQGTAATPAGLVSVGYYVDGAYQTWGTLGSGTLAAGASATIGTNGDPFFIPSGTHTITADVDDINRFPESNEANNKLSQSITVSTADTIPPSVAITSPANGVTLPRSTATITAAASDNIGIASIQFKIDGINLGAKDTSAPFGVTWSTTAVPDGIHTITAVAQDPSGNTATSSNVVITVNNTVLTALPDVIVTNFSYNNGVFSCTIKNQGTTATPTRVYIGVGYYVDGSYKTYGSLNTPLAAGASANIVTNGPLYAIPSGSHVVTADVDDINRFAETDETNNKRSLALTVP